MVVKWPGRLTLPAAGNSESQDPGRCSEKQGGVIAFTEFYTGYGLFRFEDSALPRTSVVDEIAAYNCDCSITEADCKL